MKLKQLTRRVGRRMLRAMRLEHRIQIVCTGQDPFSIRKASAVEILHNAITGITYVA